MYCFTGGMVCTSAATECVAQHPDGPVLVTRNCVDPLYNKLVVDNETDLTTPVPHHRVSGHFQDTAIRFNFYLPPKQTWGGRFFQSAYPIQSEIADPDSVAFGADSGAYTVQVTGSDGYRTEAAAAKFSKIVAAQYYGEGSRRIYGYIYGASGGSYQAVAASENTIGVWDGAVPIVQAVPVSIPLNAAVQGLASLVLTGKSSSIADAVSPGGHGDPYRMLDEMESSVLLEATKMGLPLRAWEQPELIGASSLLTAFAGSVKKQDPAYANDFWSKSGYLGTEESALGDIIRAAKIEYVATILGVQCDDQNSPISVTLDRVPDISDSSVLEFQIQLMNGTMQTLLGSLNNTTHILKIAAQNGQDVLGALVEGLKVHVNNKWNIALHTFYRHQVPKHSGFYGFDQFRNARGQPIYPQRKVEIAPSISKKTSGGGTHTGLIKSKMIVVDGLLDIDAFPWHADWYKSQVQQSLSNRFGDNYRLWFIDNTDHGVVPETKARRIIDHTGIIQQALRDISLWAEQDIPAPDSTVYTVWDSQILPAKTASKRRGIQPVVDLTVNGRDRMTTKVGRLVAFHGNIQVPPGTGQVVSTEWDFLGTGNFTAAPFVPSGEAAHIDAVFSYGTPGTYFPILRATSQRNRSSAFAKAPAHPVEEFVDQLLGESRTVRVVLQDFTDFYNESHLPPGITGVDKARRIVESTQRSAPRT
ncbi:hypothetical protein DL98DRAFT_640825 [Cadophora sp. DSE1049]|nr:hypothetical protein DL98DRAFT_640825 [Cadophora sp. DSE1049]